MKKLIYVFIAIVVIQIAALGVVLHINNNNTQTLVSAVNLLAKGLTETNSVIRATGIVVRDTATTTKIWVEKHPVFSKYADDDGYLATDEIVKLLNK